MPSAADQSGPGKTKVLFVCLGNICRSPTAEAVFKKVVEDAGLSHQFEIDSCGTGGGSPDWFMEGGFSYHEGGPSDPRMTRAAAGRGVKLTSVSRPLTPADLSHFDYILGMDASNIAAIKRAAQHWGSKHEVPQDFTSRVGLMTDHLQGERYKRYDHVPDPYYGGDSGFELVLDLLEDACGGLLQDIQSRDRKSVV